MTAENKDGGVQVGWGPGQTDPVDGNPVCSRGLRLV